MGEKDGKSRANLTYPRDCGFYTPWEKITVKIEEAIKEVSKGIKEQYL